MSEVTPEELVDDRWYASDPMQGKHLTVGKVIGFISEAMEKTGMSSEARFGTQVDRSVEPWMTNLVVYEVPPAEENETEQDGFWEEVQ